MAFYKWVLLLILCVFVFTILYSLAESFPINKEGFLIGTTGVEEVCVNGKTDISGICYDIMYIDQTTSKTKQISAKISPGYFIDASGYLAQVPFGYIGSTDMRSYVPIPKLGFANTTPSNESESETSNKNYNPDNYDITYHADQTGESIGKMWVEVSGNLYSVPYSDVSNTTLYNQPGTYKFNSAAHIPNYEESVYLSNTSNKPVEIPIPALEQIYHDVCLSTENSTMERDAKCNALDKHACMASGCCVLLGGEKCVTGDQTGPTNKSNYSDQTIINRDYYYYRNKCYGNCIRP